MQPNAPRAALALALLCLAPARAQAQAAAEERLAALEAEDLEAGLEAWPPWGSSRGERRFDPLMPDVSAAAREARLAATRRRLAAVRAIPRGALGPRARLDQELLAHELELRLEGSRFRDHLAPVGPMGGPQQWLLQLTDRTPYTTPRQRQDLLQRLRGIPAYLAQELENLRQGLREGRTPPRVVLGRVVEQALAFTDEATRQDPTHHPLYRPFRAAAPAVAAEARRVIADEVIPALRRFATFLREVYVPGCRASIAARGWPDGEAYYAHLLHEHSTTALSAAEIHATGLREVARIRAEMLQAIARTGFRAGQGDPLAGDPVAAFARQLRDDPAQYHRSVRELLDGYRAIAKRVDGYLPRLFRRLPRLSYGVMEMEPTIAPSSPTAYYYGGSPENGVAGHFVANTYRLDQRPRYEMVPLTLHEAMPGHHLQIALAEELPGLSEWRRNLGYTAFVEGWALYAERLGLEMGEGERGLYQDPLDDFGRLTYEMWRAMRLVVDTGIHAQGWTRQRAIDYMLQNSALTRENVEREVDRYISWPGQAVAYKLGELKIRTLRAEAEAALGTGFDLRAFHDVVLGQGAVPLRVLEEQVRRWIRARAAGPR
ncbi:MAG: DUF885 family protein [Planctomycetota bacterium]